MTDTRDNNPFMPWVPRPLGIAILLLMFVPPTFSGGAYLSTIAETSGSMGVWAEDIQLASFFTSIGMCLFPPFMVRFLQARKIKQTYLICFGALIVLNIGCATVSSLPALLALCVATGFVRVVVMLNCTFTIAPYMTGMNTLDMFTMTETPTPEVQYALERKRTILMPVLYFYILIISQLGNILTAWRAYHYHWQDAYQAVAIMLGVAMLLVICTMKDEDRKWDYKPEWSMVPDMLLMCAALCCLAYVLVYGKNMDWFDSRRIRIASAAGCIAAGILLWRMTQKRPCHYLPPGIFAYRNVWMSMLLFFLTMLFNAASMFTNTLAHLASPVDNLHTASLNAWAMAGCAAGLVISILLIRFKVRFRTIFAAGLLLMAGANASLYFRYASVVEFSFMAWPTVLNYAGMLMLYSLAAAFGMKSLPARHLATFVFLMIWMRNAIAPVAGASFYANRLQERQQFHIERLVQDATPESQSPAAIMSLSRRVTVQAAIVAMKDLSGQTVVLILASVGLVWLLPYHKGEST